MTKRVLGFTFILATLPFAANAASKNSANVAIDNNITVGTTELPKGNLQGRVDWTGYKCAGNVHSRQLVQNRSGTYRRRTKRYGI